MTPCIRLIAVVALLAVALTATAESNIDPDHTFTWAENVGWLNWRDANATNDGVFVHPTYLEGFIWGENIGWVHVGDGTPANGLHYANENASDYGVNLNPDTGDLFGFGWGENIGWVNFAGGGLATPPQPARLDDQCRLRGFAWAENVGWINLDDNRHYVAIATSARRGDLNCDCGVDFGDINPFVTALSNPAGYASQYPDCDIRLGDINGDGNVNFGDINPFVRLLTSTR